MSKTNESLLKRRQAAVPRGVGQIHPVVAEAPRTPPSGTWKAASTSTSPAASPC